MLHLRWDLSAVDFHLVTSTSVAVMALSFLHPQEILPPMDTLTKISIHPFCGPSSGNHHFRHCKYARSTSMRISNQRSAYGSFTIVLLVCASTLESAQNGCDYVYHMGAYFEVRAFLLRDLALEIHSVRPGVLYTGVILIRIFVLYKSWKPFGFWLCVSPTPMGYQ